ncbi:MAG TPA: ATP-dependent DNA helicase [Candidatus Eisenbacteria bacterium]|jgi:Rad3-related DNA helicase
MALVERVERAFAPDGALARHWVEWEARPGQRTLAIEVARTLEHGGVLMAEAPTGVGKSLAYLLPAVLHAAETGERVVVATCTRSLQDQLHERDLPALLGALGLELPFAMLKGKQNYLCPRALEIAGGDGEEEERLIDSLRAWSAGDPFGDLDRFEHADGEAFRRVRARVATDPAACTSATCRRGRECFWVRARRRAAEAKLVIVNHALLARAAGAEGLLPPFDALIVDEAHRLEGVLSSQLERSASRHRVEDLLRLTGGLAAGRRGGGLLARVGAFVLPLLASAGAARERLSEDLERLSARADQLRHDADALFAGLAISDGKGEGPYSRRVRHRDAGELFGRELQSLEVVLEHARAYSDVLRRTAGAVQVAEDGKAAGAAAEELQGELETVSARWQQLHDDLASLADAGDRDWAYWRSQGPQARIAELHGAPVWVGETARRLLRDGPRSAVLTSATLSAAGDFAWAAERLGLGEEQGVPYTSLTVPSPFALERQMRAYVLDTPGDEADAIAEVVAALSRAAGRNTLVLFTAHERMRRAQQRLRTLLPPGTALTAQDRDGPAGLLAERFRLARGAVLLGVQSLWEGVDFPGEALEVLVVARLPFSVPDDPVVEARAERLRERGLEPFRHDAVPEAVMRFRQGVGRLIRRASDRGVLVVCDPRLARASYRGPFRAALPVEPKLWKDPRGLAHEAGAFLAREDGVTMEESP